ncbi:hypothetical protein [Mesorhizobium sp. B2-1-3A]|uniref:hypothetical protein n=1 Tax=Mesorhizobium sp. B2-1-3A TaxID=2589971 RepID=UPI001FEEE798|nr:hypothetical protein [Mesorhizobium sp. B2-1-3A]
MEVRARVGARPTVEATACDILAEMDVAGKVSAKTLVLHRTGDRAVWVEAGRYLAARIAGVRFVEVEGRIPGSGWGSRGLEGIGRMVRVVERRGEVGHQPTLA